MSFSIEQIRAIRHMEGPALVLAGPGSGKTTVITQRILHLLRNGIPPEDILVITFTKAAAAEMEHRFQKLLAASELQNAGAVTFGTFHSIFFFILRLHYHLSIKNIITEREKKSTLQAFVEDEQIDTSYDMEFFRLLTGEVSRCKALGRDMDNFESALMDTEKFHRIRKRYQESMRSRRLLDFDDMLLLCHKLFLEHPDTLKRWQERYRYILVDEFQDISPIQYEIVRMLAAPENNLFIVGDDDQSIYHFRGADPRIMLNFENDYPKTVRILLSNNYRSCPEIVRFAGNVIRQNHTRFPKDIHAMSQSQGKTFCYRTSNAQDEYALLLQNILKDHQNGLPYGQIAVLFRTQTLIRPLLTELSLRQIPYVIKEHVPNLYEHFIAKDIIAYLRLSLNRGTRSDFLRIMNRPVRYIRRDAITGRTLSFHDLFQYYRKNPMLLDNLRKMMQDLITIRSLPTAAAILYILKKVGYETFLKSYSREIHVKKETFHAILKELEHSALRFPDIASWLAFTEDYDELIKQGITKDAKQKEGIRLMTYHASKGLEFDSVHLVDVIETVIPSQKAVSTEDIEEERRCFYVALTRARNALHIYITNTRYAKNCSPSRFLLEGYYGQTENSRC